MSTDPEPTDPVPTDPVPTDPVFIGDGPAGALRRPEAPADEVRRLMRHSVWSALCPLVPVPLIDDYVLGQVREFAAGELLRGRAVAAGDAEIRVLANGRPDPRREGCFGGCLYWTVIWPFRFLFKYVLKKLLRKIFLIWTLKDCLTAFSRTFHQGWLLRHALVRGWEPAADLPPAERWAAWANLRDVIDACLAELSARHFEHWARAIFRRSWRQLKNAARDLARLGRRRVNEAEVQEELEHEVDEMNDLIDELTRGLHQESAYLRKVEASFEARWLGGVAGPPPNDPTYPSPPPLDSL